MSQNANTLQQSFITWHRIKLLPGQQVERAITGVFFMVAEQEGDAGRGRGTRGRYDDRNTR